MSVWEDVASLHGFVYRSAHTAVMGRRKEWFERMREAYTVLWWIPRGSLPTLEQARSRLELLRSKGPTEAAFTFKKAFAAPDTEREIDEFEDLCPAT